MTLAVRNTILVVGVLVTFIALLAYVVAGWALLFGPYADADHAVPTMQSWFGGRWEVGPQGAVYSLAAAGFLGLISAVAVAVSWRLFRRVSSAEIYFMTLFFMSLSAELLRIAQPLAEAAALPGFIGVLVTRVVLFGRLAGALALFAAGVYSAGADYPRIGTVTALLALLSFLVVYFVPVDDARMTASFVHVTGGRTSVDLMLAFLSVGTVVNYAIGWLRGHRERGGSISFAIAGLVAGKLLLLHIPALLPVAVGLLLIASGCLSFVLVNRSYYLWY